MSGGKIDKHSLSKDPRAPSTTTHITLYVLNKLI